MGHMQVRILQPTRSPVQSATRNDGWRLEFVSKANSRRKGYSGKTISSDMSNEVKLRFNSLEDAVCYARDNGYIYEVITPQTAKIKPKSYANNFR